MGTPMDPIMVLLSKLSGKIDRAPVMRWGTVTAIDPLRVILDGDPEVLPFTPQAAVRGLATGARVVCIEQHRRVIVIASQAGVPFAEASGTANVPASSLVVAGSVYYSNVTVTFPAGRFTKPPVVTLGAMAQAGSVATAGFQGSPITETSFAARVIGHGASILSGSLHWHAVQMTEGSAAG